ncbi:MAG: hypothetical protein AAGD96_25845 [Chloroflexota bacterium]
MNKDNPMWRLNTIYFVGSIAAFLISLVLPMFDNGRADPEVIVVLAAAIFNLGGFGFGIFAIFANPLWVIAAFMHLDQKYTEALICSGGGFGLTLLMLTIRDVDLGIFGGPFQMNDLGRGYWIWVSLFFGLALLSLIGRSVKPQKNATESISEVTSDEPKAKLE